MKPIMFTAAVLIMILLSACGLNGSDSSTTLGEQPPQVEVTVNGDTIQVYQSSYCWSSKSNSKCADYASPDMMLKDKEKQVVLPGATIQFKIEGKQPTEIYLSSFADGPPTEVIFSDDAFQAPADAGVYYYALSATWLSDIEKRISEGSSSYVFAIEVKA